MVCRDGAKANLEPKEDQTGDTLSTPPGMPALVMYENKPAFAGWKYPSPDAHWVGTNDANKILRSSSTHNFLSLSA